MLIIRLQRFGKRNQAQFRLVLAEHTSPVRGKFLEVLGSYDPRNKTKVFKKDRLSYWASQGVQYSPTVQNMLIGEGILSGEKVKAWRPKKKEQKKEETAPAASQASAEEKPKEDKKESVAETAAPEAKEEKPAEKKNEEIETKDKKTETAKK